MHAVSSGSSTWVLPVISAAKNVAVSGERMVPPIVAAMASNAQNPGLAQAAQWASVAPMPPPMMSSGASTPPDVPEPSATAQMIAFTASSDQRRAGGMSPCSIRAMLS